MKRERENLSGGDALTLPWDMSHHRNLETKSLMAVKDLRPGIGPLPGGDLEPISLR